MSVAIRKPPRRVANILRKYGANAHVYLPGVGVISGYANGPTQGFTAGNYSDSAGTTAAVVDGAVGLGLDAAGSLGPELVTNGDFSSATGWGTTGTASISSGAGNFAALNDKIYQTATTFTSGHTYRVTFTKSADAGALVAYVGLGTQLIISTTTTGTVSLVFAATATDKLYLASNGFVGSVDNISVREVTGIHATQSTGGFQPKLRRGAVNLLTYSQDFSNPVWQKLGASPAIVTAAPEIPDPLGGTASYEFDLTPAADCRVPNNLSGFANNSGAIFSVWLKAKTAGGTVYLAIRNGDATITNSPVTITTSWARYSIYSSGAAGANSCVCYAGNRNYGGTCNNYYAAFAQLEIGATASPYIPTTSAPASSSTGNYHHSYTAASTQQLTKGSVALSMAGDHCRIVGFRCDDSAATSKTLSSSYGTTTRCVAKLSVETSTLTATWTDDASTAGTSPTGSAVTAGTWAVACARKVGNSKELWKNDVLINASTTAAGTTTLTSAAIGGMGANYLQGEIAIEIEIVGTVSDADKTVLTRWAGTQTGPGVAI